MDVIVTPAEGGTVWQLTDLLGRSMGRITASAPRQFMIYPGGATPRKLWPAYSGGRTPRSTPHWLRSKGTPGASADAILAKISFRQRPTIQLVARVSTARGFMYFTSNTLILQLNVHASRPTSSAQIA